MALDPAVDSLLRSAGYAAASHVMARASLSQGTGRNEEPLTADIADLLSLFDPYAEFLRARGSRSWIRFAILDFNRAQESRVGADFVVVVRGSLGKPRTLVHKLVLVQAKREHWGRGVYAASTNHVAKAMTMASLVGLQNSVFAYYHSMNVLASVAAPWQSPPSFLYASPLRHANQHFFASGSLSPSLPEGFLEFSAYRRYMLGLHRSFTLPPGYEWGIGMLGADFFIDAAGNTLNAHLPPIPSVLGHGRAFGDFLVDLAECRQGTPRTQQELTRLLGLLGRGPVGDGDGTFDPLFALFFDFASAGMDDDAEVPDPNNELWQQLPGIRRVPRE